MSELKQHCECDQKGFLNPTIAFLYDAVEELPYVDHEPGECKCTNSLAQYDRRGRVVTLCSVYYNSEDKRQ